MKNHLTSLILFLTLLGLPQVGRAQGKVGVINMNAAIAGTGEGKQAIEDLKKKYAPKQQELERLQQEIQADQDQLNKPGLSDDDQRRLSREVEEKQKDYKRWSDDAQSDLTADRDEAVNRIGKKMEVIIGDYAQKNGFSLVIDAIQVPIFFAAKEIDITAEIMKRYDAANPVATAAAAPAKPAATPASATKH